MTLASRVALVTGSKRIGAVMARRFGEAGADVALVYNRSHDEAEDAARGIRALGRRALVLRADVSDPGDCARIVEATLQGLGWLDVLRNDRVLREPHARGTAGGFCTGRVAHGSGVAAALR